MLRLTLLLLAVLFQLIAVILALRLMRMTKYRISWVFISLGFLLMAVTRSIKIIQYLQDDFSFYLTIAYDVLAVLSSAFFLLGVFFIGEIFFAIKRAEVERTRSEKRLLNAVIKTEEKERKRFANDMHDGIGPLLSTAKMSVSALLQDKENTKNTDILKNIELVIDEAISSIKEISNNLTPHILTNFGLVSAIDNFVKKVNETKKINIEFESDLQNIRFDNNTEITLYRIVCELINNTIKHADAKNININILKHRSSLIIQYSDDGIGFSQELHDNENPKGMGLSNISSRIKSINGVLVLNSNPNEGINVFIKVKPEKELIIRD